MKRILWAGLLILSFNTHAFLEDEEAREKINDLQNQLNSLKSESINSLEAKVTDLQQILQGGSLQQFKNNSQNKEDLLKEPIENNQALEVQENPVTSIESIQGDIAQELESTEQQGVNENVEIAKDLPPLIDEEQELNMFNDAEGLMRSTKYKEAFELFDRFVTTYPKSQRLVEAKKNIGYIQFALKNYKASLNTYDKLIANHPSHELMPEILYGKANTEIQLTRITKAKQTLRRIIKEYPNASNIESAKKRLKALESIKL
jgi:tol-pal system protein YbgF